MNTSTINAQLEAFSSSARMARGLVGHALPVFDDDMYLRPVPHGCTVLSVNPSRRPQQGIVRHWAKGDLDKWKKELADALSERDGNPTRDTPEKSLQSLLIRDAIRNKGWMKILSDACPERPQLRFLTDELSITTAEGKTVLDILAVRWEDNLCVPIAIELKSDRRLKRLTEQVSLAAALISENRTAFEQMAEAYWGETVRFAEAVERWIIWPAASGDRHGSLDPRDTACRTEGIRLVTYDGIASVGFNLHAGSRILQ